MITFSIGGAQAVGTTDAAGRATATIPLASIPGPYQLTASFAGDANLLPSGDSHPFSIAKQTTTTTLTGPAGGGATIGTDSGVVATLKDGAGAPIPFKTVWLSCPGRRPRHAQS